MLLMIRLFMSVMNVVGLTLMKVNWLKRLSIISDYALILANVAFIISLRIDGLDWINIAILLLLSANMFYIGRDFERRKVKQSQIIPIKI